MVPVYFFPGPTSSTISTPSVLELVAAAGLDSVIGDLVRAGRHSSAAITHGPDKGPGWCICQEPTTAGYFENDQQWSFIKPKNYWVGLRVGNYPTPKDLQRGDTVFHDYGIKLNDGNEWSVMALTPFRRPGAIPRIGSMDENCQWSWVPDDKYKELIGRYEKLWNGGTDDFADLAVATLAVNYRIDPYLAMAMKLFHLHDCERIVDYAMDDPAVKAYLEAQQGNAQPSADSDSSVGGGSLPVSQDLVQPLPTLVG